MAAVRTRGTGLELYVRSRLHVAGRRFRIQRRDLVGRPDIVLPRFKLAVWVHGCFWHSHDCSKGKRRPKRNAAFWASKLDENQRRDEAAVNAAMARGWEPIVIWECSIDDGVRELLQRCDALELELLQSSEESIPPPSATSQ